MAIPLYGYVEGDVVLLLIQGREDETVRELAGRILAEASLRVPPIPRPQVLYRGERLDPERTLAEVGMEPLERFDVVRGELS